MSFRLKLPPIRPWAVPALFALLVWRGIFIDPSGSYPDWPAGPGLTVDEVFNVQQGVYLAEAVRAYGVAILHPDSAREVFGHPNYLPDHPPLGRFLIGVAHNITKTRFPPDEPSPRFVTACARTASAAAFAILFFLLFCTVTRWYGLVAGVVAASSLVFMPRVFGHAHLASLETFIGLAYTATVLGVAAFWSKGNDSSISRGESVTTLTLSSGLSPPTWTAACLTGVLLGLGLLTKIQAVLLPIPITVWALFHWRQRAIVPLLLWSLTGLLVLFAGWPWLWLNPASHLLEYLGRTTDRAVLSVWYFGRHFADREVPWHYPFMMFLTTVPLGLQALGVYGVWCGQESGWKTPREQLLLVCTAFPLLVFALPGVAVYDGARLFLVVFPLWAVFIGRGGGNVVRWLGRRLSAFPTGILATALFFGASAYGSLTLSPCYLSYYNLLVGGLRGAERLGLEPTYWGDSVTRDFLEEVVQTVPVGATLEVAPVLHQLQLDEMLNQSPILRRHGVTLRPVGLPPTADNPSAGEREDRLRDEKQPRYILVFRRKADLPQWLRDQPPGAKRLVELSRQGVWLAAFYEFTAP
jgi:hypothetical protein